MGTHIPEPELMEEGEPDDSAIRRALKFSAVALLVLAVVAVGVTLWLKREKPAETVQPIAVDLPQERPSTVVPPPVLPFTNVTQSAGIDFVHHNGATGEKLLPETMGGGCAFLDYDQDGDQDLLLVNSNNWEWNNSANTAPTSALYANDGKGNFKNVSDEAGLNVTCYGMGVAVGDYDNDADPDVFISAVGGDVLLRNDNGKFVDVTAEAGVAGAKDAWGTSCGWLDYDNDADLDLIVGNYVKWSREIDLAQDFRLTGVGRAYGPPLTFEGSYPYLYRNNGDGTFADVSAEAGVQVKNFDTGFPLAKSRGIAPMDVNQDGWIDIIVANDTVRNLLLINNKNGTFTETGVEAGIAYDASGKARGAMGIDAAHFRNDECLGIAIANFANEMTALYVNYGNGEMFTDDAIATGLGPPSREDLKFGLFFFDADLDGRLDIFSANGHIENEINRVQNSQQYQQPPKLYWNAGPENPDEFVCLKADANSTALSEALVGRGAAYADIDADGDLDMVVTQIAAPAVLLRNDQTTRHHFVRIKAVGTTSNRDAIGAWIEFKRGKQTIRRQVMPTRSYLSQVELPVTIGLGSDPAFDSVTIIWPDGSKQQVPNVALDATTTVEQGK